MKYITEDDIEQAAMQELVSKHGYIQLNCMTDDPETLPDNSGRTAKTQVVMPEILLESLCRINPDIPRETIEKQTADLSRSSRGADVRIVNYENYKLLRNGITVYYKVDGKTTPNTLKLIDFDHPERNTFHVVSQLWIRGETNWRRPDLLLYVNGLPLVFIELKNSNRPVKNAYDDNLTNYKCDIPFLFDFNQIVVLSNGIETRLGSFSAGYEYFFEWLKLESEKEKPDRDAIRENGLSLRYFIDGLCKPEILLDYIENFILFDRKINKVIAKNHQYFGVNNAFHSTLTRKEHPGKLGVFWHTQGSGKSYSMRMLAGKIERKAEGHYTFLVVTDRDDLDGQIYKTFLRTEFIGDKEDVRPANSTKLRTALQTHQRILFTLIHKFRTNKGEKYPVLTDRDDIIVIVDEAHRSEYKSLAENMRIGLPNAQYLAFTGTPLLGSKRLTNQWFGDYVSEYNFAESIRDNATVPLYYTKYVPQVQISNDYLDDEFMRIIEKEDLTEAERERLENHYAKLLEVLKRDDRLNIIAQHIVEHFPERGFRGKGMVIAVDKITAVRMYDKVQLYWKEKIKELNFQITKTADGEEKLRLKSIVDYMRSIEMAVVISSTNSKDEEELFAKEDLNIKPHWERMAKIDEQGRDIEDNFKDPDHPFSLVFVCAMWLTGFDAPKVSTIYLDKPMKDHTLMQTIARANRVFPKKKSGLIVDYLNVFKYLQKALADYAAGDNGDTPVQDIEELFAQLKEAISYTCAFCKEHGADLYQIKRAENTFDKLELCSKYADIIVGNDEVKNEYRVLATTVSELYDALCPDIFKMDFDPTYKDIILYIKKIIDGKIRPEKIEKAQAEITRLLDESITAAEDQIGYKIISSEKEIDLSKLNFEELKQKFKQTRLKNLAIDNLRDYIEKKLQRMIKINGTRISFAERFRHIIDEYNAGGSENEDFFEKLLKLMEELKAEEERHIREELTEEELDIFDLLYKDKLTQDEEKRVKLAAKALYRTMNEKRDELFLVGWQNDPKPKEAVRGAINDVLDHCLPDSYGRDIFASKINAVFERIVDLARSGNNWVSVEA